MLPTAFVELQGFLLGSALSIRWMGEEMEVRCDAAGGLSPEERALVGGRVQLRLRDASYGAFVLRFTAHLRSLEMESAVDRVHVVARLAPPFDFDALP